MLEILLARNGDQLTASAGERTRTLPWKLVAPIAEMPERVKNEPERYGSELFDHVFSGELSGVLSGLRRGQRILLAGDDPAIQGIAWEYLRNREGLLAEQFSLVRLVSETHDGKCPALEPPLEILAVPPAPVDDDCPLNVEHEYHTLREVVSRSGKALKLIRVRPPTLAGLRKSADPGITTFVHFMGHSYSGKDGSYLLFEKLDGTGEKASAAQFADAVQGAVVFVVLNSCLSAASGSDSDFGNIARGLVQEGIPYALGMQFSILDKEAHALTDELYGYVFKGHSIEGAVRHARASALAGISPERSWLAGIPVLYTNQREAPAPLLLDQGQATIEPGQDRLQRTYGSQGLGAEPHFVGRSGELKDILTGLHSGENYHFIMLHGLGGCGKTTLARAAVERVAWHYDDHVFMFSFERFARFGQGSQGDDAEPRFADELVHLFYSELARFYGIQEKKEESQDFSELRQAIIQLRKYRRSLLFIDNFETLLDALNQHPSDEAQTLAQFVMSLGEGQGDIILTSRTSLPASWGRCCPVEVGGLDDRAGSDLFLALLDRHRTASAPKQAREALSHRVGGHPLCIKLLAARFNLSAMPLDAFLDGIEEELKEAEDNAPRSEYDKARQRTLYACLAYSVRRLSPEQREALRAVGLFHQFVTDDFAAAVLGDHDNVLDALDRLGLLKRKTESFEDGTINQFEVPPPVRWYAAQELPPPNDQMRKRYGRAYKLLADRFEGEFNTSAKLRAQIANSIADFTTIAQSTPGFYLDQDATMELATVLGEIHGLRGELKTGLGLLETAYLHFEPCADPGGRRKAARARQAIARINMQLGHPGAAMQLYRGALAAFKQLQEDEMAAAVMNEMASALLSQGEPRKALTLHRQALHLFKKQNNELQCAWSNVGIADVFVQTTRPHHALRLYQEALQVFESRHDLPRAAVAQTGVATVLRQLWHSKEALAEYEKVLKKFEALGLQSQIASTHFAIGEVMVQLGKYHDAEVRFSTAGTQQEAMDDKYAFLVTNSATAEVMLRQDRPAEAYELFTRVLDDAGKLGEKRTITFARKGLADAKLREGRYEEALPLYEKALECATDLQDLREKAVIQFQYSQALVQVRRIPEALRMLWNGYKIVRRYGFERDTRDFAQHLVSLKAEELGPGAFDNAWSEALAEPQPKWLAGVRSADAHLPEDERAVRAFVRTRSVAHARELVEEHPELYFSPQIEQAFVTQIGQARAAGDEQGADLLEHNLEVLRDILHSQRQAALQTLLDAKTWERSSRVLKRFHAVLLTAETEALLKKLVGQAKRKKDQNAVRRLEMELRFLQESRQFGIDVALARVEAGFVSLDEMRGALDALPAFLEAQDPAQLEAAIRAHPGLVQRGTRKMLQMMIHAVGDEDKREDVSYLLARWDLLECVARLGVEQTFADPDAAVTSQRQRREIAWKMNELASSADHAGFRQAAQQIGDEECVRMLRATMDSTSQKEVITGGVAILTRLGGELAERTLGELLATADNRKSEDIYLAALRDLSVRGAKYASDWMAQRPSTEQLEIHVGEDLVPLFDPDQGGTMLGQLKKIREEFLTQQQLELPKVRVTNDLWLSNDEYEVIVAGETVFAERTDTQQIDVEELSQHLKRAFAQQRERIWGQAPPG